MISIYHTIRFKKISRHSVWFQALFTFGTYEVGSRPETGGGGGRKLGGGPDTYCILSAVDID